MNQKQKIIIIFLVLISFLVFSFFLGKNYFFQKPQNQQRHRLLSKVTKKRKFAIFFRIIVIIAVLIIVIILIIKKIIQKIRTWRFKKHLLKKCFPCFDSKNDKINIVFGDPKNISATIQDIFACDIQDKKGQLKEMMEVYNQLSSFEKQLNDFVQYIINFFQSIDGHLLQAFTQSAEITSIRDQDLLSVATRNFQRSIRSDYCNQEIILSVPMKFEGYRELKDFEKQYLTKGDYFSLFKVVMKSEQEVYLHTKNNNQHFLFERYFTLHRTAVLFYRQLTTFFSQKENNVYAIKYKTKIDKWMKNIEDFLEIKS